MSGQGRAHVRRQRIAPVRPAPSPGLWLLPSAPCAHRRSRKVQGLSHGDRHTKAPPSCAPNPKPRRALPPPPSPAIQLVQRSFRAHKRGKVKVHFLVCRRRLCGTLPRGRLHVGGQREASVVWKGRLASQSAGGASVYTQRCCRLHVLRRLTDTPAGLCPVTCLVNGINVWPALRRLL